MPAADFLLEHMSRILFDPVDPTQIGSLDPKLWARVNGEIYRFASLLMVVAIALGLVLWLGYGVGKQGPHNGWLYAKLVLVVVAIGYHHACRSLLRKFEEFANVRSERWFRVFNETTVVLFTAIVVLVVVKPF